jgi:hypothetical protein
MMTDANDGNKPSSSVTSKTPEAPETEEVCRQEDEIIATTTSSSSSLPTTTLSQQKQKQKQQQKYQARQQQRQIDSDNNNNNNNNNDGGGGGGGGDNKKIKKNKIASRARHRLNSIFRDAQTIQQNLLQCQCHHHQEERIKTETKTKTTYTSSPDFLLYHALQNWKLVANERCGSWYVPPPSPSPPSSSSSSSLHGGKEEKIGDKNHDDISSNNNCYFKSTDGHINTWEFSLKRLNLSLLEKIITIDGGCFVIDSSVRKIIPDSMSKTIPIWATVLNRIVLRYKYAAEANGGGGAATVTGTDDIDNNSTWDTNLYTPKDIVSIEEHANISSLIDDRVDTLFKSGAIVNPKRLIERLTKPLRVIWMNHKGHILPSNTNTNTNTAHDNDENDKDSSDDDQTAEIQTQQTTMTELLKDYFVVLCWNPSQYVFVDDEGASTSTSADNNIIIDKRKKKTNNYNNNNNKKKQNIIWIDYDKDETGSGSGGGYYYTPGAADDQESWARHLTPTIFWMNQEKILDPRLDDDQVDTLIDELVQQAQQQEYDNIINTNTNTNTNTTGTTVVDENNSNYEEIMMTMMMINQQQKNPVFSYSDRTGNTNLWIGSRRAGRPPECWGSADGDDGFDAILNVTNQEYADIIIPPDPKKKDLIEDFVDGCNITNISNTDSNGNTDDGSSNGTDQTNNNFYYLQLPVEEGKRDKTQLEKWMTIGLVFLIHHLQKGRRVLVHCAQGKDRSVAVALACVIVSCPLQFPLQLRPGFHAWDLSTLVDDDDDENDKNNDNDTGHGHSHVDKNNDNSDTENTENDNDWKTIRKPACNDYLSSGIPTVLVTRLLNSKNGGRELFLAWVHSQLQTKKDIIEHGCLADKESIRIALHLIRQDREAAEPTRSTMQKINRFFMSADIYRSST